MEQDRSSETIADNHVSVFAGYKGINKIYKRLRDKYCWSRLKAEVENFIDSCFSRQLQKLIRVKKHKPITLTDSWSSLR